MLDGMYHEKIKWHGVNLIVDLAKVDGMYEVMALDETGEEYDSARTKHLEEAVEMFRRMLLKFIGEPHILGGKYAKFRDDLDFALDRGKEEEKEEDDGTCNFDSTAVRLKAWNKSMVRQIAKECGIHCFEWKAYGEKWWVFTPRSRAQANARTRNAATVTYTLGAMGYETMDYQQMD